MIRPLRNNASEALSYDILNHLVQWSNGSGQESYIYDASGNRVLRKSTSGVGMTVYAFGSEEYFYSPNGTFSNCKHYYTLAGHLIAELNGSTLQFELTDALGSVLMSLSSSAVLGEQVYGPYGNRRYTTGSMGTNQGYTGQTNDPLTGLDYYNARYYDSVVGVFLSADDVQGNVPLQLHL